jgi:hypothetical protein
LRQQPQYQAWRGTIRLFRLTVLLMSFGCYAADKNRLSGDDLKIRLWNLSGDLRGGFGCRDNVLLSHTNAQGSAFWMSGAEMMVFRLPTRGWQFSFFAEASDTRYFNSPSADNEQLALAVAQLSKDFGNGWKSALGLNYLFQNQVFDYSDAYTNQSSIGQIVGHTFTPRWALRKTLGAIWVEGELSGTRQWLATPLDSYWQFGPRAAAGYGWGRGSELALSYQYTRLDYDSREQVNRAGAAITNTALALNTHITELSLTQFWDQKRHWQTITTAGFETSLDNGSSFYNYDCYHLSERVRYRDAKWEVAARGRLNHHEYSTQTVSATDTALRRKTMINLTLRVERKLAKHLKAHASYDWDRSISNLEFDDYQANVVMGGLALTF